MSVSLIDGHMDPDTNTISSQISDLLENHYMLNGEDCTWISDLETYDMNGRTERYITEDIEEIMKKNHIKDFFIEVIDVYDSPGIDCKCLCVSWIKNDKLDGFNQPLYRY